MVFMICVTPEDAAASRALAIPSLFYLITCGRDVIERERAGFVTAKIKKQGLWSTDHPQNRKVVQ
jgi:hypothetical protein